MYQPQIKQRPFLTDPAQFTPYVSPVIAKILARRDVISPDQLQLNTKHLLAPTLKGIQQAVEQIHSALEQQHTIVIIGDYDADGATSTALMILALKKLNTHAKIHYLVPDRFKYGYGLTPAIVELAYQTFHPNLLITVDNGISSHEGVQHAQTLKIKVVITDHHLTTKAPPPADAVVNPNQLGCDFPSKTLAGVGVAFYVLACLMRYRQSQGYSFIHLNQFLDLVALGTYADVAGLDYNNRILIYAGIKRIQTQQCRLGILALLHIAKRLPEQLQAHDLGFILGPRLNAAGRMDNMQIGIECLLAEDWQTAFYFAEQLNQFNLERKHVEQQMKQQALAEIQHLNLTQHTLPPAIILYEPHWHQGVTGIVAGRLKEQFHRPSVIFAEDIDSRYLKGSARSIAGIHIRDMIECVAEQSPHLVRFFGGHAAAAGLTIEKQYFQAFKDALTNCIAQHSPDLFQAVLWTDGELSPQDFSLHVVTQLEQLTPWGHQFPSPIFEGHFHVIHYRWLKDQHLKLTLAVEPSLYIEAIAFYAKEKEFFQTPSSHVFLVYELTKNEFNGQTSLQLNIIYMK